MPEAAELQELTTMRSDPDDLLRLLSVWTAVYLDKQRPATDQDEALAAILRVYWPNRTGEVATAFLGVGLLMVLIDAYRNGRQREDVAAVLFDSLAPIIRKIAKDVSGGWMEADFVEEAVSFILAPREQGDPRICRYDPAKSSPGTWLRTVLGRGFIDRLRKEAPRPGQVEDTFIDPRPPINPTLLLGEELWRCVVNIPPSIRLPGLIGTGLWGYLSADMQRVCLAEYNSLPNAQPLSPSFPEDVLDKRSTRELRPALARAFGCSPALFSVRVHRFLKELRHRFPLPDFLRE